MSWLGIALCAISVAIGCGIAAMLLGVFDDDRQDL